MTRPWAGTRWLAVALLWLLLAATAVAQSVAVPLLASPVVDTTGTLDTATVQVLSQKAQALQQRKGSQLQVLVVPTTGGEAIEGYARRVFDQWKLGRAGVDDGVLLLVALEDRRVRIEPGYGLEGAIPDAIANRIIDEYLVPRFRAGDYSGGIDAATTALVGLIDGEPLPPPVSGHRRDAAPSQGSPGLMVGVVLGLVAGSFLGGLLRPLPRLVRGGLAGVGAALAGLLLVGGLGVAIAAALVAGLTALIGVTPAVFAGHGGWGRGGGFGGGMGGGGFGGGWGGGGGMSGGGGASGSW